jgi:hypothetical protein
MSPGDLTNIQPGREQNIFAVANLNNRFTWNPEIPQFRDETRNQPEKNEPERENLGYQIGYE